MDDIKTLADGTQVTLDNQTLYVKSGKVKIPISDVTGLIEFLCLKTIDNELPNLYNKAFIAKVLLKKWVNSIWKVKQHSVITDAANGIFIKFDNTEAADSACKFFEDHGWKTLSDGRRVQIYQDD